MKYTWMFSSSDFGCQARAHQDTYFNVSSSGNLSGLPKKYEPASVVITESKNGAAPSVEISVAHNRLKLPACIARYFKLPTGLAMEAKGSWYHDKISSLPPYLALDLPQKAFPEVKDFNGISLLFNLDTLALLEVEQRTVSLRAGGARFDDLNVVDICTKAERDELKASRLVP